MTTLPPAIIFVNSDLNASLQSKIQSQLQIHETISGQEFDNRIIVDPNYKTNVELNGLRVLVIRDSFHDLTNRTLADVVIFVKNGLAYIEKNNFGPPGQSYSVDKLNIYNLLRANNSPNVVILPSASPPPNGLGGIFSIQSRDTSGVNDPNPDNIYNNPDFINRK